jgi:hypothetical protein
MDAFAFGCRVRMMTDGDIGLMGEVGVDVGEKSRSVLE